MWSLVENYKSGGIIVEELVQGFQEFSCDSVSSASWLTSKTNATGKYRWESEYILPSPLDKLSAHIILEGGRYMASIAGAKGGAYHNEIFYNHNTCELIAVEPNLRPAGGRIWDAAKLAFRNFDPWVSWIREMTGKPEHITLTREYYVGFKMITSPIDGKIVQLCSYDFPKDIKGELTWTKKSGDIVRKDPRDNSECLGYILIRHKKHRTVQKYS